MKRLRRRLARWLMPFDDIEVGEFRDWRGARWMLTSITHTAGASYINDEWHAPSLTLTYESPLARMTVRDL